MFYCHSKIWGKGTIITNSPPRVYLQRADLPALFSLLLRPTGMQRIWWTSPYDEWGDSLGTKAWAALKCLRVNNSSVSPQHTWFPPRPGIRLFWVSVTIWKRENRKGHNAFSLFFFHLFCPVLQINWLCFLHRIINDTAVDVGGGDTRQILTSSPGKKLLWHKGQWLEPLLDVGAGRERGHL